MVYSSEIRWFFHNQSEVSEIENWFNRQGQSFTGNWQRADIYLWQNNLKSHSVKIREGKVEVKILQSDRGEANLPGSNTGKINDWVKYSFDLNKSDEENKNLIQALGGSVTHDQDANWIKVDKERLLLKYAVNYQEDQITQVTTDAWPEEGCGVELTRIEVNKQAYFTFGLEAFSKNRRESENLEKVLFYMLEDLSVQRLETTNSFSYPDFLASLNSQ